MSRTQLKLAKLSSKQLAYSNCVYLCASDMTTLNLSDRDSILIDEQQIFQVKGDPLLKPGNIGTSGLVCKSLHLQPKQAFGTVVTVEPWATSQQNKNTVAQTVSIVVDTYIKATTQVKVDELEAFIKKMFVGQVFCKDQRFIIKWVQNNQNYWLQLLIASVYKKLVSIDNNNDNDLKDDNKDNNSNKKIKKKQKRQLSCKFALIDDDTNISLMSAQNPYMKLEYPASSAGFGGMTVPHWDAEQMGIGGLDSQFTIIFRRAFASRLFPADIVQQLGIKHVKGLLLHGPPGTGKTLIARNIGAMLTDNEPKVVNGPEILNKYVGQSEENVRKLFAEAIEEQKEKGDNSSLHIIIFDEIDAICKQRGSSGAGGTGVHDTVVNQILSMIDGVNALNNVLVIGMTNRKDLLDDALLRSGRLEVHIEIGLPDQDGREQIFRIHTKNLRENGYLDQHISIADLAKRTKNYTGAEIAGVVRSAVSYAMQTHIDVENIGKIDVKKLRNIKITKEYFDLALEEVLPELGRKKMDDQLSFAYQKGIFKFNKAIEEILNLCGSIFTTMTKSNSSLLNRQSLLIKGAMRTGKTAISSYIANNIAAWPFIRLISADNFVGAADITICNNINKSFNDAYKSNQSIIILDDIERIIGYTLGPRFSNSILQAILTCIRRSNTEDPDRQIFIIGTCSNKLARELSLDKQFDFCRLMPTIRNKIEFKNVLNSAKLVNRCSPNLNDIVNSFPITNNILSDGIGIADLLTALELSLDNNNFITKKSFLNAWNSKFTLNNASYSDNLGLNDMDFDDNDDDNDNDNNNIKNNIKNNITNNT